MRCRLFGNVGFNQQTGIKKMIHRYVAGIDQVVDGFFNGLEI
jgi:hypothetical protein